MGCCQKKRTDYIDLEDEIMTLIYKVKNENVIRIFGKIFVENNKKICFIEVNGKKQELKEFYPIEKPDEYFEIKLIKKNKLTNMSYMFNKCESLSSLYDASNWNTSYVTDMSTMFNKCISLSNIDDISIWNTSKVKNMSYMFNECKSLISFPDISIWNTSEVKDMSYMFNECRSLSSLPDISKWNTNNLTNINLKNLNFTKNF